MDWKTILTAVVSVLAVSLPPGYRWVAVLLQSLLSKVTPTLPAADVAPGEFKEWLKGVIVGEVGKVKIPFVAGVLTAVVNRLDGVIIDQIWKIVFPKAAVTFSASEPLPPSEFAAAIDAVVDEHAA